LIAKQLGGAAHPTALAAAAALSEGLTPWLEGKNADPLVREGIGCWVFVDK